MFKHIPTLQLPTLQRATVFVALSLPAITGVLICGQELLVNKSSLEATDPTKEPASDIQIKEHPIPYKRPVFDQPTSSATA